MKCTHCKLCLIIIRAEEEEISKLYYYCDLCRRVYRRENYKLVELEEKKAREIETIYLKSRKQGE
jgi:ferredoxin